MMKCKIKNFKKTLICLIFLSALTSCSDNWFDDSNSDSSSNIKSGIFYDAPVEGLNFESGSEKGKTDSSGTFKYEDNNEISFSLSDIFLGKCKGQSIITVLDLVGGTTGTSNTTASNIAMLLQSLDNDQNPDNNIKITQAVIDAIKGTGANITSSNFSSQMLPTIINKANQSGETSVTYKIVTADSATKHMQKTEYEVKSKVPDDVKNLKTGTTSASSITLSWDYSTGSSSYDIYRKASSENSYGKLSSVQTESIEDKTFRNTKTYSYRVYACNKIGCSANYASVLTPTNTSAAPNNPSNFRVMQITTNQITLGWDTTENATYYQIYKSLKENADFSLVANNLTSTNYNVASLSENTKYYLKLSACNTIGCSSGTVTSATTTKNSTSLGTPSITNIAALSSSSISLSWGTVSGASYYKLQRGNGENSSTFSIIENNFAKTSYTNTGLTEGSFYTYQVAACNTASCSNFSSSKSVQTKTNTNTLSAPTITSITALSTSLISLSWGTVSGASYYKLQRGNGENSSTFSIIENNFAKTSYTNTGLTEGSFYTYQVAACNTASCSNFSSSKSVQTKTNTNTLSAPTITSITALSTSLISLSWGAISNASYYKLQRGNGENSSTFSVIESNFAKTSYTNTGLTEGSFYTYQVAACNTSACSSYSSAKSLQTKTTSILAPTITSIASLSTSSISLSWNTVSNATYYRLQRGNGENSSTFSIIENNFAKTSYTNTELTEGSFYTYRVAACTTALCSNYSSAKSVQTQTSSILAPTITSIASLSTSSIGLSWNTVSNATYYRLQRGDGENSSTFSIIENNFAKTSYTNTGLTEGSFYTYRVAACTTALCSNYSSAKSGATKITNINTPTITSMKALSSSSINLSWGAVDKASYYKLERGNGESSSTFAQIANNIGQTSYTDLNLAASSYYTYKVAACHLSLCSSFSSAATIKTKDLLNAPENLQSVAISSNQIKLSWNKANGAEYYLINKSQDSIRFSLDSSTTAITKDISNLDANTRYFFQILSKNSKAESAPSVASEKTKKTKPNAPVISGTLSGNKEVQISWAKVSDSEFYKVFKANNQILNSSIYEKENSFYLDDKDLNSNQSYQYYVLACNSDFCSDKSNVINITPKTIANTPAAPTKGAITESSISLTLPGFTGGTSYKIYRADQYSGAYQVINNKCTQSTYLDNNNQEGLKASNEYIYKISECNEVGCSALSTTMSAITSKNSKIGTNPYLIFSTTGDYQTCFKGAIDIIKPQAGNEVKNNWALQCELYFSISYETNTNKCLKNVWPYCAKREGDTSNKTNKYYAESYFSNSSFATLGIDRQTLSFATESGGLLEEYKIGQCSLTTNMWQTDKKIYKTSDNSLQVFVENQMASTQFKRPEIPTTSQIAFANLPWQLSVNKDATITFNFDGNITSVVARDSEIADISSNGASLTIKGKKAGRTGLKIVSNNKNYFMGLKVNYTNGEAPGLPENYLSVGVVSEDIKADIDFWEDIQSEYKKNNKLDIRYTYASGGPFRNDTCSIKSGDSYTLYDIIDLDICATATSGVANKKCIKTKEDCTKLNGEYFLAGWQGWQPDRIKSFAKNSLKFGLTPFVVFYAIPDGHESSTTVNDHFNNKAYMDAYIKTLKIVIDQMNGIMFDDLYGIIVEPDSLGYFQQNYAQNNDPSTVTTIHGKLPDSVKLINNTIIENRQNAVFGWLFNLWGGNRADCGNLGIARCTDQDRNKDGNLKDNFATNLQYIKNAAKTIADFGQKTSAFSGADFIAIDRFGADIFAVDNIPTPQPAKIGEFASSHPYHENPYAEYAWSWNSDHWNNYFFFAENLKNYAKLPVVAWQIPISHLNGSKSTNAKTNTTFKNFTNNKYADYEDSASTWFLGDTFDIASTPAIPKYGSDIQTSTTVPANYYNNLQLKKKNYFCSNLWEDSKIKCEDYKITWENHMSDLKGKGINALLMGPGEAVCVDPIGKGSVTYTNITKGTSKITFTVDLPSDDNFWIQKVQEYYNDYTQNVLGQAKIRINNESFGSSSANINSETPFTITWFAPGSKMPFSWELLINDVSAKSISGLENCCGNLDGQQSSASCYIKDGFKLANCGTTSGSVYKIKLYDKMNYQGESTIGKTYTINFSCSAPQVSLSLLPDFITLDDNYTISANVPYGNGFKKIKLSKSNQTIQEETFTTETKTWKYQILKGQNPVGKINYKIEATNDKGTTSQTIDANIFAKNTDEMAFLDAYDKSNSYTSNLTYSLRRIWESQKTNPDSKDLLDYTAANYPDNVKKIQTLMPQTKWNAIFSNSNALKIYSYENFLRAAFKFPKFCGEKNAEDIDTSCKQEIATILAHIKTDTKELTISEDTSYVTQYKICTGKIGEAYPCYGDTSYHPRGPAMIAHNYNYGAFSLAFFKDLRLLEFPDMLATDGYIGFASAIWDYLTPKGPAPSMHDVVLGFWNPGTSDYDYTKGIKRDFGATINIKKGAQECTTYTKPVSSRTAIYSNIASSLSANAYYNSSYNSNTCNTHTISFDDYEINATNYSSKIYKIHWDTKCELSNKKNYDAGYINIFTHSQDDCRRFLNL